MGRKLFYKTFFGIFGIFSHYFRYFSTLSEGAAYTPLHAFPVLSFNTSLRSSISLVFPQISTILSWFFFELFPHFTDFRVKSNSASPEFSEEAEKYF